MIHNPYWRQREAGELARKADRLCVLIVASDYPLVDIQIERSKLREEAEQLCPDRIEIYERIYESRFDRLIEQFRHPEEESFWSGEPKWE